MEIYYWQWFILLVFGLAFIWIAPWSKNVPSFFSAKSAAGKTPGVWLLTSSLVISWIFAKSITNAANLGLEFGIVGGVAYGAYYLSFLVAGIIIYQMRTQGGFTSIHQFLTSRYGRTAVILFSLLVGFRLFNEVWSNTMVIGSYFGEYGSSGYFAAILAFTLLTLIYTLKGGLRSSLLTDAIQMIFFGILLILLLGYILPGEERIPMNEYVFSGNWSMNEGVNLLLVALIQVFSYPFHDAVLTDRGFISEAKITLKSYLLATIIGFICIVLFSLIGVFAQLKGLEGQAAVKVGKLMGGLSMLLMNFIMITSAASTLDSAFSSSAKLIVIDIGRPTQMTVRRGRIVMSIFAIIGTIPVFFNPAILSATTISGTMVLGLAPIFIFWKIKAPVWSFYLALGSGILVGIFFAVDLYPSELIFFNGKYGDLLSANIIGTILSISLFWLAKLLVNGTSKSN